MSSSYLTQRRLFQPSLANNNNMSTAMLPPHFDGHIGGLYEGGQNAPRRFLFRIPRVVPNQKEKFESEEIFRRLARESEVSISTFYRKKI